MRQRPGAEMTIAGFARKRNVLREMVDAYVQQKSSEIWIEKKIRFFTKIKKFETPLFVVLMTCVHAAHGISISFTRTFDVDANIRARFPVDCEAEIETDRIL